MKRILCLVFLLGSLALAQVVIGGGAKIGGSVVFGGSTPASLPSLAQTPWACGMYGTNPSCTATSGSNATAGDVLVDYIYSPATLALPTGCVSGAWTLVNFNSATNQAFYIGTVAATGSCAVTESTVDATATTVNQLVYECSGCIATIDQYNYLAANYCSTCTGPSVTTTVNNDLIIAYGVTPSGTVTMNSPFNTGNATGGTDYQATPGSGNELFAAHAIKTTAGAISATWTETQQNGGMAIVAIKP